MCDACQLPLFNPPEGPLRQSRRDLLKQAAALATASLALAPLASVAPRPAAAQKGDAAADVIFHGGTVLTVDPRRPVAEALALRGGRIIAVGSAAELRALATRDTELIDLHGNTVLPGFIDPHLHVVNTASVSTRIDVSPFVVSSLDQVLAKLRQAAATTPAGEWIVAFGYDPSLIPPFDQTLGFANLDPISTASPIFVMNLSGHLAYTNSTAFALAGVTAQTPDVPPGGRYLKDANGQLTGEIAEPSAMKPFLDLLPSPSPQQFLAAVQQTLWSFQRAGCTTVNDNGTGTNGLVDFTLLFAMASLPDAPVRISAFPMYDMLSEVNGYLAAPSTAPAGFPTGLIARTTPSGARAYATLDGRFQLAGIKIWQDGSVQGLTAALREPYLNSTSTGFPNYSQAELTAAVQAVHDAGWMASIHCNGDAAVEAALNAYESVLAGAPPGRPLNRIEHCTLTAPDQIARFARLGITPSFTINHVYYWGEAFRDRILGASRAQRMDALADCVRAGIPFSIHCDAFTTPCAPLSYIQTAVTRRMRTGGEVLGPDQRITVDEAIKAVTLNAAFQLFLDHEIGSLEPGKRADLVVLGSDPRRVPPDQIGQIPVIETWLDGQRRTAPAMSS